MVPPPSPAGGAGTGLARQSTVSAIATLEKCHLVRVIRGQAADGSRQINFYQLITRHDYNRTKPKAG